MINHVCVGFLPKIPMSFPNPFSPNSNHRYSDPIKTMTKDCFSSTIFKDPGAK